MTFHCVGDFLHPILAFYVSSSKCCLVIKNCKKIEEFSSYRFTDEKFKSCQRNYCFGLLGDVFFVSFVWFATVDVAY